MTADFYIIYECTLYFSGENADIFHRQPENIICRMTAEGSRYMQVNQDMAVRQYTQTMQAVSADKEIAAVQGTAQKEKYGRGFGG